MGPQDEILTTEGGSKKKKKVSQQNEWARFRHGDEAPPKIEYEDTSADGNQKLASLYNLAWMDSDSDIDDDETMFTRNRSGLSDRALEHFTKGLDTVGYNALGKKVVKVLTDSSLQKLLDKDSGKDVDAWKTIIDFANQKQITLSREDIETIRRIQVGQFPGINTDYYSPGMSVVDFDYATPDVPLSDTITRASFERMNRDDIKKIDRIAKLIARGKYVTPEEQLENYRAKIDKELDCTFDIWASDIWTKARFLPMIAPPKEELPSHNESYRPPNEFLKDDEDRLDALRKVKNYKSLVDDRMNRLLDLSHCERSYRMSLNIDRESLLPPLPPLHTLRPFPTDLKLQLKGVTVWRKKGEEGDNLAHFSRVMDSKASCSAVNISRCGHFMAVGDSQGVVSVIHYLNPNLPGVIVWRDTLHVADNEDTGIATPVYALRFHPKEPILAICKGLYVIYVILPEMRGELPRKLLMSSEDVAKCTEEFIINSYWQLYEGTSMRNSLNVLGLSPDGGPAAMEQVEANRSKGSKLRAKFTVSMMRHKQEDAEIEEMGDEEVEVIERAGVKVDLKVEDTGNTRNEMFLRSRPGLSMIVRHRNCKITNGNWNEKGTYFAACSVVAKNPIDAVVVHFPRAWQSISVAKEQLTHVHSVAFHPKEPLLFLGHFQGVRCINLQGGKMNNEVVTFKKMKKASGAMSMDVHSKGNVIAVGNSKQQLLIYDMEAGLKPCQRLDMNCGTIKSVSFHPTRPLLACVMIKQDANGKHVTSIRIVHVSTPELSHAFAIPVKILDQKGKGNGLGTLTTCQWHPREPWLMTGHSDGSVCSWH